MKIDVEGAEAGVLRGMMRTLRSLKPALVIELHNTGIEVADLLDEAGYRHGLIESSASTREGPWWAHVLAQAPESPPARDAPTGIHASASLSASG
jgi:hypothetical protein